MEYIKDIPLKKKKGWSHKFTIEPNVNIVKVWENFPTAQVVYQIKVQGFSRYFAKNMYCFALEKLMSKNVVKNALTNIFFFLLLLLLAGFQSPG